ncbi:MBL fold metallo-hydrolase [Rhizosaccharibacter radicis]|uniref:MBL fold metallo-hydrolase n=1 Tax=Rhizosaccharibacter radicis TaxID=2782605 RepID=A0ABT1VT50_9PROT|nr:MBL fold metallo-hydrolase [Acetobacteraceae bacterium KSS12]
MAQQVPIDPDALHGTEGADGTVAVAPDLSCRRTMIANVLFLGVPHRPGWVLVDAGVTGSAHAIEAAAARRFGEGVPPAAILLTHGHFDHVGALHSLLERWDVPVYAHPLEMPYLDGSASYPPADPGAGGGLMTLLAPLFPRSPVDVRRWLRPLPPDNSVPGLSDWQVIHTPGHSVGHVSFWRERDGCLVAGDAFTTTAPESAYATATQEPELHGPPRYFTHDWQAAHDSVRRLAALQPEVVVTGHGRPMHGQTMRTALHGLADRFEILAVPEGGRYVNDPQRAEDGSAYRRRG